MRTDLVADALLAAAATRGSLAGAIFHGDHGAQYTSRAYAALCGRLEVTRSMGAVGSSADNALAESFNATLKRETLAGAAGWDSPAEARRGRSSAGPPGTTPAAGPTSSWPSGSGQCTPPSRPTARTGRRG